MRLASFDTLSVSARAYSPFLGETDICLSFPIRFPPPATLPLSFIYFYATTNDLPNQDHPVGLNNLSHFLQP